MLNSEVMKEESSQKSIKNLLSAAKEKTDSAASLGIGATASQRSGGANMSNNNSTAALKKNMNQWQMKSISLKDWCFSAI